MKKFLCLLLVLLFFQNIAFCVPTQSDNSFAIIVDEVPPGGPPAPPGSSSNNGATTAIVLGSVFGSLGLAGALGGFLIHNAVALSAGSVIGATAPICPVNITPGLLEKIAASPSKYCLLAFALKNKSDKSKFIIVEDREIKNKTFDTVIFETPNSQTPMKIKLTQVSSPFELNKNLPEIDSRIFLDRKKKNEVPLKGFKIEPKTGIIEKTGTIGGKQKAYLITAYKGISKNAKPKKYAVLIEFEK